MTGTNNQIAEVDFASLKENAQLSAWLDKNTGSKFGSAPKLDAGTVSPSSAPLTARASQSRNPKL